MDLLQLIFFFSIINIRYIISLSYNLNKERKMFKNIKYKKIHVLLTIIQIFLIVVISGWYYFSERKMGMIRHIFFRNVYKFPKYFTATNLKVIIACFIVFLVIQLVLFMRARRFLFSFILNIVFVIFSIYFIINYNADKVFIYYYLIVFCGLFNLTRFLQFLTLNHKVGN